MGKLLRTLIGLPLLLIILGLGALYVSYGQVDPCRALAVERARRAENASGLPISGVAEPWTRFATSQLSTRQCASALLKSWWERASHDLH